MTQGAIWWPIYVLNWISFFLHPLGYQFVPPPEAASAQLLPPLTPHQSLGQIAKPQHPHRHLDRNINDSPGAGEDTSLDTPPSNLGIGVPGTGSRPGSAHSAPLLDLSIDRYILFAIQFPGMCMPRI